MTSYLVVLGSLAAALFAGLGLSLAAAEETNASYATREEILASTIQIEAYDDIRSDGGVIHSHMEHGLGTLVAHRGQWFILTHNHWRIAHADLDWVELYDGYGRLLVMMDREKFTSLRRFHDAGTLLIAAPAELSAITPVSLGDSSDLAAGDRLWITTRDEKKNRTLQVSPATVKQSGGLDMPGKMRLSGPQTAVAPGDSGGGVWKEGRLVGNMWAIVESHENSLWSWLFGSVAARPTGEYVAARLPRVEDIRLPDPDQASHTAGGWIYDPIELP